MRLSKTLNAGISKLVREQKNLLVLTDVQKEILLGVILGDVTVRKEGKLKFEQQYDKKEYVEHLYEMFKEYINVPPQVRKITGGGASDRYSIWVQTVRYPIFKTYYEMFYKQKVDTDNNLLFKKNLPVFRKGIGDVEFLEKWLTPRAIAYWFMDDGTYGKNDDNVIVNYTLATHGFEEREISILSNILNKNYNLSTKIHVDKIYFKIYIPKRNVLVFRNLIKEYVVPCFYYKLFD